MSAAGLRQSQHLCQPQLELHIVGNRGIAGPAVCACAFDLGDAREISVSPRRSSMEVEKPMSEEPPSVNRPS
jgi:hypothetical protein